MSSIWIIDTLWGAGTFEYSQGRAKIEIVATPK
jgi:hypothetical protein